MNMRKKILLGSGIVIVILVCLFNIHRNEYIKNLEGHISEVTRMKLYLDEELQTLKSNPMVISGNIYVPAKEFLKLIDASMKFKLHSVEVNLNGKTIELNNNYGFLEYEGAIDYNDILYYKRKIWVPLRVIAEEADYIVEYDKITHIINIFTKSKFKTKFLTKEQADITNIKPIENVEMFGDRRFMLSDNPEVLSESTITKDQATLWNDIVKENTISVDHRVVGWHINDFLFQDITIGITIENLSTTNTIEVKDLKGMHKITATSKAYYDIGLPISEALLNEHLNDVNLSTNEVKPNETLLLGSFKLNYKEMIGFLNDFTVTKSDGTGELNYIIRTVVSEDDSDLTEIKSEPVPVEENNHPRGVWPSSELVATLPTYNVGTDGEISYNISNGQTDNVLNTTTNLVTNAVTIDNKGHYGIVYKVKIPYVNNSNEEKTIKVRIGSRGGLYNGTIKTEDGVFNIPKLTPMKDVANVIERKITDSEGFIEFDIMHANGTYLPISINISTIGSK